MNIITPEEVNLKQTSFDTEDRARNTRLKTLGKAEHSEGSLISSTKFSVINPVNYKLIALIYNLSLIPIILLPHIFRFSAFSCTYLRATETSLVQYFTLFAYDTMYRAS